MSLISKWKGPVLPSMREMDMPTTPASSGTRDCLSWIRPREPRKNLLHGIFTYLVIKSYVFARHTQDNFSCFFFNNILNQELTASRVLLVWTKDNANDHSTKCQSLFSPVSQLACVSVQHSTFRLIMYFLPSPLMFIVRWVYSTQWSISFSWIWVLSLNREIGTTHLGKGASFRHTGYVHITCVLNSPICGHPGRGKKWTKESDR